MTFSQEATIRRGISFEYSSITALMGPRKTFLLFLFQNVFKNNGNFHSGSSKKKQLLLIEPQKTSVFKLKCQNFLGPAIGKNQIKKKSQLKIVFVGIFNSNLLWA
jgi:hypothetical protein